MKIVTILPLYNNLIGLGGVVHTGPVHTGTCYALRPKEIIASSGTRLTGHCEPYRVGIRNKAWVLLESIKYS